ncbi:MAG: hypothetical protein PWP08_954 [Methanofollis sp.]|nr:hypothetical protein [Methanofollis sp.]
MKKLQVLLLGLLAISAVGIVIAIAADVIADGPVDSGEYIDDDKVFSIVQSEVEGAVRENISIDLVDDALYGTIWECSVWTKDGKNVVLGIDARTGEVKYFIGKAREGLMGAKKQISIDDAKQVAADYVGKQKIDGTIQFDEATYINPHAEGEAGTYHVFYERVIDGVPCLSDGISLYINAETGEITNYFKRWRYPDEIPISSEPNISETEAREVLSSFMKEKYNSSGLEIGSAELKWADATFEGEYEGSRDIRLTWWLRFGDDYTWSYNIDSPALAWIDAHTGEVLKYSYEIG